MASEKFGRYRIEKKLGTGSMGVVYKAFDPVLKRHLAIKVISEANAADQEFVERFFREAQATAGLNHPNIVSLYDIGENKKQPYIAVDFGVAKLVSSNLTTTGMLMGTPSYMSPEQVSGQQSLDGRSDIFGLGVIVYELIAGTKPFPGTDFRTVMMAICNRKHTPLKETLPGCPDDLEALMDRALAKEPEDRFQSASEFATALRSFRAHLPEARQILKGEVASLAQTIAEIAGELEKPEGGAPHP